MSVLTMASLFTLKIVFLGLLQAGVHSENSHHTTHIPSNTSNLTLGEDSVLYFAYDTDMLKGNLRIPSAVFNGTGKLKDYVLSFGVSGAAAVDHHKLPGSVANIEERNGSEVWGVIWKISSVNLNILNKQQGVNRGSYQALLVKVETKHGEQLCRTYQMKNFTAEPISPQLKQALIYGAEQNGLPHDYITKLNTLEIGGTPRPEKIDPSNHHEKNK